VRPRPPVGGSRQGGAPAGGAVDEAVGPGACLPRSIWSASSPLQTKGWQEGRGCMQELAERSMRQASQRAAARGGVPGPRSPGPVRPGAAAGGLRADVQRRARRRQVKLARADVVSAGGLTTCTTYHLIPKQESVVDSVFMADRRAPLRAPLRARTCRSEACMLWRPAGHARPAGGAA
jgi:hypothetical protein